MRTDKRITIFAGHNGSGKTQLTVNLALELSADIHRKVIAVDMDTVKPYFRTCDFREDFKQAGVRLIAPELANSSVDLPTLTGELRAVFDTPDARCILDVGGDDAGAIALGQYAREIRDAGYDLLLVANPYRYLTREPEDALRVLRDIEDVSQLRFTGIVHNPNLGAETTAQTVADAVPYAKALSAASGLPIVATAYPRTVTPDPASIIGQAWPIDIYLRRDWVIYDI